MGSCTGSSSKNTNSKAYQQLPPDIQNYNPRFNPHLQRQAYQCQLYNVKVSNIQFVKQKNINLSIKFSVPSIIDIFFPLKTIALDNLDIKWKTKGKFAIKGNQYDIRRHFLQISTFNLQSNEVLSNEKEKQATVGFLKINLYQIMSGPSHNDFKIKIAPKVYARIIFDLKISQIVQIKLKSTRTFVQFFDMYPSQKFNFTIKAKVDAQSNTDSHQKDNNPISAPSYIATIPLISQNSFKQIQQLENENDRRSAPIITAKSSMKKTSNTASPIKRKLNRKVSKIIPIQKPSTIQWKRQQSDQMPSFKIKMKSSQISTTILQVFVWKIVNQQKSVGIQKFGQWNIPLIYLLDPNHTQNNLGSNMTLDFTTKQIPSLDNIKQSIVELKSQIVLKENLRKSSMHSNGTATSKHKFHQKTARVQGQAYDSDKKIGKYQMQFEISNTKYITQKHACSRTEDGIINMSHVEIYGLSKIKNDSFSKLCQCYSQIVSKQKSINLNQTKKSNKSFNKYASMKGHLKKFLSILEETRKQSLIYCSQKQLQQMMFRQQTLLNIANQVKQLIEDNQNILSDLCWQIESQIFKRGELLLSNIGFRQNHQVQISNNIISDLLKKKIQIGLKYQQIVYSLLQIALSGSLYYYGGGEQYQDYRQVFKVNCFLAVPLFRQKLLKQLTKKQNVNLQGQQLTRSTQLQERYKISSKTHMANFIKQEQSLLISLQYEAHFYKWIRQYSKSKSLNQDLSQILTNQPWIQYIVSRKNGSFYSFIRTLMGQLQKYYNIHQIPQYQYVPGYNKIVGYILKSMAQTDLLKYQAQLINASISLLINKELVNSFMQIIFQKTNLYCQTSVSRALDLMEKYFAYLTKNQKIFFKQFHHIYFLRSLRPVFEGDSVILISKALILIYSYFPFFNEQFKKSVSMYLMGKVFFRMFYHWSIQIRCVFHYIFIIRIAQCDQLKQIQQFNERYETILKIIVNAENARVRQEWHQKNNRKKQKEFYCKMKNKLKEQVKLTYSKSETKNLKNKEEQSPSRSSNLKGRLIETQKKAIHHKRNLLSPQPDSYAINRARRLSEDYDLLQLQKSTTCELKIAILKKQEDDLPQQMIIRIRSKPSFFQTNKFVDITQIKQINTMASKSAIFYQVGGYQLQLQTNQQYELNQLLENQVAYIVQATNEFRELNRVIQKEFNQKGQAGISFNLQNQIYYDHKEIRPGLLSKVN